MDPTLDIATPPAGAGFNATARVDVLKTVDKTCAEPVAYQAALEALERTVMEVVETRKQGALEAEFLGPHGPTPLDISIAPRIGERGKSLGAGLIGRPLGALRRAYCELEESHLQLKEAQTHLVRDDGQGEMTDLDLAATAQIAVRWVMRGARRAVSIKTEGDAAVFAHGRPEHIQQVIVTLFQNAVDAVEGVSDPEIKARLGTEGGIAFVQIADNGPGIGDEIAPSVFDPFFTTKDVGKGTGLGLSVSHKIAEEHGGALALCFEPGKGACFTRSLPVGGKGA